MPTDFDSHLAGRRPKIEGAVKKLKFIPLTLEEEEENRQRGIRNRAEEARVSEVNRAKKTGETKEVAILEPMIEPHVQRLDTTALEAAIAPLVDTVLPCLEIEDPIVMQLVGLLFFWAPTQYKDNKDQRTTFMELGAKKAGDYSNWFTELKKAADHLISQEQEVAPTLAELFAWLHPVASAKLPSVMS